MNNAFNDNLKYETIVMGGGCFWCTEAVFQILKGVLSVEPGYSGGNKENLTYEEICSGKTGHAESIQIKYNPDIISFKNILIVFFATHDPTTKNRQGNDIGEQYRSIIFYTTENQKNETEKFIENLNSSDERGKPIITEVKPFKNFYLAEDYHKNYYEKNKNQAYCQAVINPKLKNVREKFAKLLK